MTAPLALFFYSAIFLNFLFTLKSSTTAFSYAHPSKTCKAPAARILSGHVVDGEFEGQLGDLRPLECDDGFEVQGMPYVMCMSSGWTRSGRCVRKRPTPLISPLMRCKFAEPTFKNGIVMWGSSEPGSVRAVVCQHGFEMVGVGTVICNANGYWYAQGQCVPIQPQYPYSMFQQQQNHLHDPTLNSKIGEEFELAPQSLGFGLDLEPEAVPVSVPTTKAPTTTVPATSTTMAPTTTTTISQTSTTTVPTTTTTTASTTTTATTTTSTPSTTTEPSTTTATTSTTSTPTTTLTTTTSTTTTTTAPTTTSTPTTTLKKFEYIILTLEPSRIIKLTEKAETTWKRPVIPSEDDLEKPMCCSNKQRSLRLIQAIRRNNITNFDRLLLDGRADPNSRDSRRGLTALMWAASLGHVEMMITLLGCCATYEARANDWSTALLFAAKAKSPEAVELLVKFGANVDAQNRAGETALIIAAKGGQTETIESLKRDGADLEVADQDGTTALMWAAMLNQVDATRKLIELGANVEAQNDDGETAIDLAVKHGQYQIVELFELFGSRKVVTSRSVDDEYSYEM